MKRLSIEPIKLQVFVLILVFITAYFVIFGINSYVSFAIKQYDNEIVNNRAESSLGNILSGKLFEIENSFIKIINASKLKEIEQHSEKIFNSINDIEKILEILQNGGIYKETTPVNIINKNEIQEIISYTRQDNSYVLEVIELNPKIIELKNNAELLITKTIIKLSYTDSELILKEEAKIDLLMKQVDTYFRRSHESVNKIFYDTTIKINTLVLKKEESINKLKITKIVIYFLTLLIGSLITFLIYKKISLLIKERKEYLVKIKESSKTIQQIFEAVPVGILIIDKEKKIQQANNTALKLFDTKNKEDIILSDCRNCFNTMLESSCPFDDNIPLEDIEINLLSVNGKKIPIVKNVIPIKINNEDFLLEAFMDISEQKEIEEKLKIAKDKADESNKLKSAFLANMSHEIRTPMNGILGFSQFLTKPQINSKQTQKYAKIIIKSGNHLLNIINDIIDVSRIESGYFTINESVINLNRLLKELYSFFHSIITEKNKKDVKLKINLPIADKYSFIKTDSTRLKQILTNLINNAVKFTETGSIEYGYIIENNKLTFHIKDTGIGIHKDKQKVIFERFNQASDTTEKLYGGTGLGLTISKACVEMLGGDIWLKSKYNKGSEFYFTIPYKTANIDKHIEVKDTTEIIDLNQTRILIVEDDYINYTLLSEILLPYNIDIVHTENAEEAIEIIKLDDTIKLVLMDIQLPGKDGNYATKEIKKLKPEIPVVVQSAFAFEKEKEISIKAGCDDYLVKPVNIEDLNEIIIKYLKN